METGNMSKRRNFPAVLLLIPVTFIYVVCGDSISGEIHWNAMAGCLFPVDTSSIRLVEVAAIYDQIDQRKFHVESNMVFRNEEDYDIETTVAFPVIRSRGTKRILTKDLTIMCNGSKIPDGRYTEFDSKCDSYWGGAYLYEISFRAREPTRIQLIQDITATEALWKYDILRYMMTDTDRWLGTINTFRIECKFNLPPNELAANFNEHHVAGVHEIPDYENERFWPPGYRGLRTYVTECITQPIDSSEVGFRYDFEYLGGPRRSFQLNSLMLNHQRISLSTTINSFGLFPSLIRPKRTGSAIS